MRMLLVEDHEKFAKSVQEGMESAGFACDWVPTGAEADAAVAVVAYDAIILDRGLPDMDGLEFLRGIRDQGNTIPVLVLTARDSLEDRIQGLNTGGDDYLLKPAAMEEVIARVRALLRRPGGALGVVLSAGNVSFDTVAREVQVANKTIAISRREMEVLEHLLRRKGRVVPKDVMEEKLYGFGEEVTSNSVEVHVSRLRKRLTANAADIQVHTLRGVGYLITDEGDI